jgi:hypothetical protein
MKGRLSPAFFFKRGNGQPNAEDAKESQKAQKHSEKGWWMDFNFRFLHSPSASSA